MPPQIPPDKPLDKPAPAAKSTTKRAKEIRESKPSLNEIGGVPQVLQKVHADAQEWMSKRLKERKIQGRDELSDETIETIARLAGQAARVAATDGISESWALSKKTVMQAYGLPASGEMPAVVPVSVSTDDPDKTKPRKKM